MHDGPMHHSQLVLLFYESWTPGAFPPISPVGTAMPPASISANTSPIPPRSTGGCLAHGSTVWLETSIYTHENDNQAKDAYVSEHARYVARGDDTNVEATSKLRKVGAATRCTGCISRFPPHDRYRPPGWCQCSSLAAQAEVKQLRIDLGGSFENEALQACVMKFVKAGMQHNFKFPSRITLLKVRCC